MLQVISCTITGREDKERQGSKTNKYSRPEECSECKASKRGAKQIGVLQVRVYLSV
jgi:hypothetical protein